MYATSGRELGSIGLALSLSIMETLVDKGVLSRDEAKTIIGAARDEIRAAGSSVSVDQATKVIDGYVLPRFGGKA